MPAYAEESEKSKTGPPRRTHSSGSGLRPRQHLLDAALELAGRGWFVFPLRVDGKKPAFPDHDVGHCAGRDPRCRAAGRHVTWEERASTDPARIRAAWSLAAFNVGVACGPSGLVLVDLDMPHPGEETPPAGWAIEGVRDGRDVFAVLCERAGQPWPVTRTVTTGRGGAHLYFQHPGGPPLRNTQGTEAGGLGWLVDTRAHGGYVVGAGSIVAGRPYTVEWDSDPAPLPAWLTEALTPRPLPPQQPARINLGTGRRAAYLQAAVSRQVDLVATAQAGGRNHALYLSAVALGQLVAGGELDACDVTDLLTNAAQTAGLRGGPREAAATIASGLRAGAARPRSLAASLPDPAAPTTNVPKGE